MAGQKNVSLFFLEKGCRLRKLIYFPDQERMKLGENRKKRLFQHSRLPRFKVRRSLECLWCAIFRFSPIFFFSCSGKCINFFNLQPFPKNKDLNFSVQPLGGFGQKNRCPSFYAGYCTCSLQIASFFKPLPIMSVCTYPQIHPRETIGKRTLSKQYFRSGEHNPITFKTIIDVNTINPS